MLKEKTRRLWPAFITGYSIADRRMKERLATLDGYPYLTDLRGGFDDVEDSIFVDFIHVSPKGNDIVARRIAKIVREKFFPTQD